MTPQKAVLNAANNLIQAFKLIRLDADVVNFDILQQHGYRAGPSGRQFLLDRPCMEAIEKAARKLYEAIGSYPRENAHNAVTEIVVAVRDRDIPAERAHAELSNGLLEWLRQISVLGDWEVLHAVRGVHSHVTPFTIGRCQFFRMDKPTFFRWGQRFATGEYEPPNNAPVFRSWVDQEQSLIGQTVALAAVRACDSDHATAEGRRVINESLDLLRYGQVAYSWSPGPVPEVGLAPLSQYGYLHSHTICIRRDKPGMSTGKCGGGADGADIGFCKHAPAWNEIEKILLLDTDARTEMQRRSMLALSWVGQSALASSWPVRLVALTTALETLLIGDAESLGKKAKLSSRVAAFPKMAEATGHIGADVVKRLYGIRSGSLHAGRTDVEEADVRIASMAVAQCFSGLLRNDSYSNCRTIAELLAMLPSAG